KMAVDDEFKGRGIGFLLGEAALQRAKELGGKRVFLDSNTTLQPAINLYRKLGFKRMDAEPSPYARCNIQMEVLL
ncbi:MAG: GNAT family N-acetyltransferase, partial [Pseudomonadales bacterium]|nr:GNAT family N-acetyltransferase [Pseudomonadales bacterium]